MATKPTSTTSATVKSAAKLGVGTLMIMNIVAVVSLRGLPAEAVYGMSSAFYYLFAAIVFLIPVSLVAAELASLFPYQQGGMFRWIGEAFGSKLGFLGIWLQWVESTIWFPTVLTFGAVSLAFIGMDHVADSHLAANKFYTIAVVLAIYWIATLISMKGLGWVGKISKIGGMVGTIIPAGILVVCGVIYLASGGHSEMNFHGDFFPDLTNFDNVVLAASIFLFYAGMEMSGVHVRDIKNPAVNYPKAVFGGALVTVLIFVLGTYALGVIIPAKDINLVQSLLVGFDNYFQAFHMNWFTPVIAIALAFGVLAGVLTWVAGPSKGVFAVGQAGYLPPFFQKTNKSGVQKNILLIQGGGRDAPLAAVRGDALGREFLPDSLAAHSAAVPDSLPADVRRSDLSALLDERGQTPVPHRHQRQLPSVDCGRNRFPGLASGIRTQFPAPPTRLRWARKPCGIQCCSAVWLCS